VANIYFTVLTVLQFIKPVSITSGTPTILPALLMVIGISMLKDLLEDKDRWHSDEVENQSQCMKFSKGGFKKTFYRSLFLGDVVRIENN